MAGVAEVNEAAMYRLISPLPPRTRLGIYDVRDVLGRGGFGISYRAFDTQLQREVVLKEHAPLGLCTRAEGSAEIEPVDEELYNRSLASCCREARVLAALRHEGIVQVYEIFEACNTAFIVLEYVEGTTLAQYAATKPLTEAVVTSVLTDVLKSLSYLHGKGVLHRDIKPSNIMINEEGKPILIDFGAAACVMPTHTLTLMASPSFSPPEQFSAPKAMGPWSDLFALGRAMLSIMPQTQRMSQRLLKSFRKATELDIASRYRNANEWLDVFNGNNQPMRKLTWAIGASAIGMSLLGVGLIFQCHYEKPETIPAAEHTEVVSTHETHPISEPTPSQSTESQTDAASVQEPLLRAIKVPGSKMPAALWRDMLDSTKKRIMESHGKRVSPFSNSVLYDPASGDAARLEQLKRLEWEYESARVELLSKTSEGLYQREYGIGLIKELDTAYARSLETLAKGGRMVEVDGKLQVQAP